MLLIDAHNFQIVDLDPFFYSYLNCVQSLKVVFLAAADLTTGNKNVSVTNPELKTRVCKA